MRNFILSVLGLLIPAIAAAKTANDYGFDCKQIPLPPGVIPGCASGSIDVVVAVTTLATNGYVIAGAMAIVVILYGALRMVISRGAEGKEAGRKAITYGIMGFIFIALTAAIVSTVKTYMYAI